VNATVTGTGQVMLAPVIKAGPETVESALARVQHEVASSFDIADGPAGSIASAGPWSLFYRFGRAHCFS
jgi:hypothetical protein